MGDGITDRGGRLARTEVQEVSDILDGIARIRIAFKAVNLEAPTAILLGSHKEGMKFMSELRGQLYWSAQVGADALGRPVEMADGSVWMEVKVMDIAVRWPANKIAIPDGSWSYV